MATNKKTLLTTIKTKIAARTWGGTGSVVFPSGSVYITNFMDPEDAFRNLRSPFCLIIPGDFRADPLHDEEPDYLVGTITIRIGLIGDGDILGQNAIMGRSTRVDSTKSEGAGLEDIAQEVHAAINKLNVEDSLEIQFRGASEAASVPSDTTRKFMSLQDILFEAICTTE